MSLKTTFINCQSIDLSLTSMGLFFTHKTRNITKAKDGVSRKKNLFVIRKSSYTHKTRIKSVKNCQSSTALILFGPAFLGSPMILRPGCNSSFAGAIPWFWCLGMGGKTTDDNDVSTFVRCCQQAYDIEICSRCIPWYAFRRKFFFSEESGIQSEPV